MDQKKGDGSGRGGSGGTRLAESGQRAQTERQQRQAAALRANLRRRKEQQRGREAPNPVGKASSDEV